MRRYTSSGKPAEFELDGVEWTVPGVNLLDLLELAGVADLDADSPEGLAAIADLFRNIMGEQYGAFKAHCRNHNTKADTLLDILTGLIEDASDRPTKRPSDSADGPPTTGRTWKVISSDGTVTEVPLTPEKEAELRLAAGG